MSNRTLVELNHDYCPPNDDYLCSGNKDDLPKGVTFKHIRHHSSPDPMKGQGDPS